MTSIKPPVSPVIPGAVESVESATRAESSGAAAQAAGVQAAGPIGPSGQADPIAELAAAIARGELSAAQAMDCMVERALAGVSAHLDGAQRAGSRVCSAPRSMAIPRCAMHSAPRPPADRFVRALTFAIVLALLAGGPACSGDRAQATEAKRELPPPPKPIPEASDWAARVGKPPVSSTPTAVEHAEVRTAVASDATEDSAEQVSARRLVYRVSLLVPHSLQDRNARVSAAAGELHIDASLQRLRARFVGPGWPVNEGVEVRLRPDVPGVYLFVGGGGGGGGPWGWF